MLRFGDIAFLAGILLAFRLYGTIELTQLVERVTSIQSRCGRLAIS